MAALLGINPRDYLHASSFEVRVLGAVIEAAAELRQTEIKSIGVAVANALAEAMKSS